MIRKLKASDNDRVMEFLKEEAALNLFIIGDIEAFGYDSDFQELWGFFGEDHDLSAVLLRFHNSFIPYAKTGTIPVKEFSKIIKAYPDKIFLSGISDLVEKFENIHGIDLGKKQVTYFAECNTDKFLEQTEFEIKQANTEDVDRIIELRAGIEEFHPNPNAREILRQSMETGTGRTYYLEQDGQMVASASTAAENSMSAMIVGVCTHNDYRRKGLATAVMQKLFKDVMDEGKSLCLFYDNPEAGRIYKRLGFVDIGLWTMFR
ncbi:MULTISPECIES: GNAT family N-acetyltransferase [unclassified Bacillus (in: firmicutes)]|uniref:GNAT family N-acetyltransferase n=1 Tax=unclassified Bacillus (in: firmicutes) TaxID=185979 RepID=UPI001BE76394|nr:MULTISPECIES: GNAT family N-acetyltransferase [unclassified Bacillus (in: firmicutes)]MBT2638217.1 GNAT family N-acetyltransferase [Bacillus sp. ISL-39]MBT2662625.1 GNAT family N-acetyltransferase [Bacillus sp. ISL-45]